MIQCNTLYGQIKGFLQGNISYIPLLPGQYLDIACKQVQYQDIAWKWKGGFYSAFNQIFDLPFNQ